MTYRARAVAAASLALLAVACAPEPTSPDPDATGLAAAIVASGQDTDAVVPGELVVKTRDPASIDRIARGRGLGLATRGDRFHVLRVPPGQERRLAAELGADAEVEWAEPNYLRQPTAINPNLWAFYNPGGLNMKYTKGASTGQPIGAGYASILDSDEDNIEGYAAGGTDVVIGSLDTGVELTHTEFTGRLIVGRDWANNDNNPADDNGHGTHTTGTMAGSTVGVAGVSGAASHVKVYVQKVCGKRGCPSAAIASAIRAAADQPNMVAMNLSLGGSTLSNAERDAIAYAMTKNVLVIASAGNSGTSTVACPACDPNAISVASTTWRDELASYSQYGSGLDIAAPGGQCYSNTTAEGCIYSAYRGGGYAWLQGTSMAAPQVTGTAAIVASKTGLRGAALRARIEGTADDKGTAGYDTRFGNGRLNSYRAVTNSSLGAGL